MVARPFTRAEARPVCPDAVAKEALHALAAIVFDMLIWQIVFTEGIISEKSVRQIGYTTQGSVFTDSQNAKMRQRTLWFEFVPLFGASMVDNGSGAVSADRCSPREIILVASS